MRGKRQDRPAIRLAHGKIAGAITERLGRVLQMQRLGVVNLGLDAARVQVREQLVALLLELGLLLSPKVIPLGTFLGNLGPDPLALGCLGGGDFRQPRRPCIRQFCLQGTEGVSPTLSEFVLKGCPVVREAFVALLLSLRNGVPSCHQVPSRAIASPNARASGAPRGCGDKPLPSPSFRG